jgi:NADH-quinone oxidoreductase subunit C
MSSLDTLEAALRAGLGDAMASLERRGGEITIIVRAGDHAEAVRRLRDDPALRFDMMVDLCGVDWRDWGHGAHDGPRFSVAMHLLSIEKNWRVRVHTFCPDDDFPMIGSVIETWPSASWFEREAFDLFGIIFEGHPDLRRILTDYGFVGHPFRKDFPISGNVEMRYDPEQRRVIYQPVTIEPREITPRVVREQGYAAGPITDKTT